MGDWLALGASPTNLYGVDLKEGRLGEARSDVRDAKLCCADAAHLPFADASFDLVSAFTLFSSVTDDVTAERIAADLQRVLTRDGCVLYYDMRYPSPRNPNVRSLRRNRIESLFTGAEVHLHSVTLLPPLARRLRPRTGYLYGWLAKIRPLRSHYLGLITPGRAAKVG